VCCRAAIPPKHASGCRSIVAGNVIIEINGLPASLVGQAEFGVMTKVLTARLFS
jgi:hypothetical protein